MEQTKYKIGLGLSGGGTRGTAHIGVLKAFEEENILPEIIAGTSAGAIVGSLYASGCSTDEILDFVASSSFFKAYRLGLPTTGFTNFSYLHEQLAKRIKEDAFEALKIPLHIGITNLLSGQMEIKDSGPLFSVVQASASIPTVFKSVAIGDGIYVDGGLLNNLPVQSIRPQCQLLIGVNAMPLGAIDKSKVSGIFGIAFRSVDLNISVNSKPSLELCDIIIEPQELLQYGIFNFKKAREVYQLGYDYAKKAIPEIKKKLEELNLEKPHNPSGG